MAWWIFQHLVTTTALAAAVLAWCRLFRPGPVTRHALWVLVLLKFVTPPVVEWPWTLPDPMGLAASSRVGELVPAETVGQLDLSRAIRDGVLPERTSLAANGVASTSPVDRASSITLWTWLAIVWLTGSVWMLGLELVRFRRVARRLAHAAPADRRTLARVANIAGRLGVAPPPVRITSGMHAPYLWSAGRAALVLPGQWPDDTTETSIDALIVHELAHLKRRDHVIAWMQLAAGLVWWWNPLFWYVRATVREQAELACDAWVIATLPDGRRAYAESLITLSGPALQGRTSPSMAAVVGADAVSRRMLERRLVMIMKGRTPLRLPVTGVITLGLAAAITLPAWASGQQAPPPPPPAPKPPVVVQTPAPAPPARRIETTPRARAPLSRPSVTVPAQRPAPTAPARYVLSTEGRRFTVHLRTDNLPEDAQKALAQAAMEEVAIREEADRQIEAKRLATTKALEALQDQYTKAGKLDEALAIRTYLQSATKLPVIKR